MAPFASPSSGRNGRYRRRIVVPPSSSSPDQPPTIYSSSAVAAAELAASSIVSSSSDTINKNKTTSITNAATVSTVVQNLRASRARLLQRHNYQVREERWFKFKLICLGIVFVIGLFWIGGGGNNNNGSLNQDQRNLNHYDDKKKKQIRGNGSSMVNTGVNNDVKTLLSVPPPPNKQRIKIDDEKSSSLHHHKNRAENKQPPKTSSVVNNVNANKASSSSNTATNNNVQQQQHHHHIIPPIVTFTYHTNLLTTPQSQLTDSEDIALSQNVQEITTLHSESQIRFLNDDDCLTSIQSTLGPNTNLTTYFTNERHGMYKADICRGAALYETGGLYFDIDVETRHIPLWDVIAPQTEFVTTLVHSESNHVGGFFQAFIGVIPQHPVMKRYLELFVEYYEGKFEVKGPLGVYFLRMAYDEIIKKKDTEDNNTTTTTTTELWQEVRYSSSEFPEIHRSRWGKRRACQMMVVAPPRKMVGGFERKNRMVPLFSHANGSRMCGGKDTNRNGNSDTA